MLNADEIEAFKAFFPPGYSIYKKHKTITIPKNLIRILIIVMIVIIMITSNSTSSRNVTANLIALLMK